MDEQIKTMMYKVMLSIFALIATIVGSSIGVDISSTDNYGEMGKRISALESQNRQIIDRLDKITLHNFANSGKTQEEKLTEQFPELIRLSRELDECEAKAGEIK